MTTIYGIKNCDTMKKARRWLDEHGVEYTFHDYKVDGLDSKLASNWLKTLGLETVINKRGTTWRKLPDDVKAGIDEDTALTLMLENPSIIKRPLLDTGKQIVAGFSEAEYASLF